MSFNENAAYESVMKRISLPPLKQIKKEESTTFLKQSLVGAKIERINLKAKILNKYPKNSENTSNKQQTFWPKMLMSLI